MRLMHNDRVMFLGFLHDPVHEFPNGARVGNQNDILESGV